MIFFAECRDGSGFGVFEEWVERFAGSAEMERALRSSFVLGGHKAWWLARLGEWARIFLVSRLPEKLVRQCHLHPATDPESVLRAALAECGASRMAYIPHAGFTLPAAMEQVVPA